MASRSTSFLKVWKSLWGSFDDRTCERVAWMSVWVLTPKCASAVLVLHSALLLLLCLTMSTPTTSYYYYYDDDDDYYYDYDYDYFFFFPGV